jgi:tetratricopeptide (TPR) repeat protein
MTFSHGDYSKIDVIRDKDKIAEKLYKKSLGYYPNHRAYLGLGIIKQKSRGYRESIEVLSEGLEVFPDSKDLNTCLGLNYMNLGKYETALNHFLTALNHFLKFSNSKDALYHAAACYKEMGDSEQESAYLKKAHNLEKSLS